MKDLLLFPFNGNAREAASLLDEINAFQKEWNLLGFIDDSETTWGKNYLGHEVLGGREILRKFPLAKVLAVPGRSENHLERKMIIDSLFILPERFANIIHPRANLAVDTQLGYNLLIMAGATTTGNVTIGNHCLILPNSVLSHDVYLGDYSIIGSNVSISGQVRIHPLCYIGTGSKIISEITLGEGTLVGIGSVVIRSTDPYSVVAGHPTKFIRTNTL